MPIASPPVSAGDLLTPDEVAKILRISKASVYRLVERRQVRFRRVCGLLRFALSDIEMYLSAGTVEPVGNQ